MRNSLNVKTLIFISVLNMFVKPFLEIFKILTEQSKLNNFLVIHFGDSWYVPEPDEVWMVSDWSAEYNEDSTVVSEEFDNTISSPAVDSFVNELLYPPKKHKPFQCVKCGAAYTMRKNLHTHLKNECGKEATLQCPLCPMKTKRKGNLKRHLLFVHSQMWLVMSIFINLAVDMCYSFTCDFCAS